LPRLPPPCSCYAGLHSCLVDDLTTRTQEFPFVQLLPPALPPPPRRALCRGFASLSIPSDTSPPPPLDFSTVTSSLSPLRFSLFFLDPTCLGYLRFRASPLSPPRDCWSWDVPYCVRPFPSRCPFTGPLEPLVGIPAQVPLSLSFSFRALRGNFRSN